MHLNTRINTLIMRGLSATEATHQAAIELRYSGTITEPPFAAKRSRTGRAQTVFEYHRGFCTDAYVTEYGQQL